MPKTTPKVEVQEGTFPMSLHEFALTTNLNPYEAAGLEVYATPGDRYKEEWAVLLEEFRARPITE